MTKASSLVQSISFLLRKVWDISKTKIEITSDPFNLISSPSAIFLNSGGTNGSAISIGFSLNEPGEFVIYSIP